MSHCIRPAQQRQAAIAQHTQAANTQHFFNLLTSPELLSVVEDHFPEPLLSHKLAIKKA